MPPNQVTKIGKYDVLGVLGQGGMGVVYKGVDSRIGRPVAIKMMTTGFAKSEDALRRFYREAQSVGVLQHPNIVIVYDLGDEDGTPYLVMEFLNGEPLDHIIASRRELSIVEKLDVIIQVLHALDYAHRHRIVHRDVKPGNVMVMPDGHCKLVDFGIARGGDLTLTHTGQIIGSMSYMSPEQLNGRDVDGRTDIWSAAVVLYELLTGHLPFEGREPAAMIVKILNEAPPPLSSYLSNYPPELDDILSRALSKDREERYHAADDLAFDLAHVEELLKAQMVSDYVEQARFSMAGSDLGRARELLSRVLKVDTQNPTAKQLLYEVQQLIHKQQRGEQVRALRERAEEALSRSDWEEALSLTDQALKIDKTNLDLLGLRESILQRKARKEQVLKLVHLAEAAQHAGELDMARRAIDDALGLDPNDTQAKVLGAVLTREIQERQRFEGLLKSVRGEAASGHFTQAAQLLKEAEALRPQAPEIPPLKSLITAGREEQLRHERLETLKSEAAQLLEREQFVQAQAKAEEALRYDPADRGVLDLLERTKALQQNRWVEQQLAAADKLVNEGRITAAITLLETASSHLQDARLQKQIPSLRQKHEQQKVATARAAAVSTAKDAWQRNDYDRAIGTLERARSELGRSTEIEDLLTTVRAAAAEAVHSKRVAEALQNAQRMLDHADFEDAEAVLQKTLDSGLQDESLDRLLSDARRQRQDFKTGVDRAVASATAMLEQHKADDAIALLSAQPPIYSRSMDFRLMLDRARTEQKRQAAIAAALHETSGAMRSGDLEQAWQLAQGCRARYGETTEIHQVLAEIEAERTRRAREAAERAAAESRSKQIEEVRQHARSQIEQGELEPAIAYLESVAAQLEDQGIERLLAQARSELQQFLRGVEAAVAQARNLLDAHKPADAIAFLESQPESYSRAPACRALLEHAHTELEQQQAAAEARRRRVAATLDQARNLLDALEFDSVETLLDTADSELHDESLRRFLVEVRSRKQAFRRSVESIVSKAGKLLEKGKGDEALTLLSAQPPAFARVDSFATVVQQARNQAGRQSAVAAVITQSRALAQQGQFDTAVSQIESVRAQLGDAPALAAALKEIDGQRAAKIRSEIEHILDQAQLLLRAGRHQEAATTLEGLAAIPGSVPDNLMARAQRLSSDIAQARVQAQQTDNDRGEQSTTPPLSATVLFSPRGVPAAVSGSGLQAAAAPTVAPELKTGIEPVGPAPSPPPKSKRPLILIGVAAVVLVAAVAGYFVLRPTKPASSPASIAATPAQPSAGPALGSVLVEANVDQADVRVDGALKSVTDEKKATLSLLPGRHEIQIEKSGFESASQTVEITKDTEAKVQFTLAPAQGPAQQVRDPYLIVKAQPGTVILVDKATVGTVQPDGSYSVQLKPGKHRVDLNLGGYEPWSTTVTAKAGQTVPVTAQLKAIPKPGPSILSFTTSVSNIQPGQPVELRWQTRNASEVSIDHGIGTVQPSGSHQVSPTTSTTYVLTAKGEGQPAQGNVTVTVAAVGKPAIVLFESGADRVEAGHSTRLAWATQNANEVSIDGIGPVDPTGSREVKPGKTTTYVLTAKGSGGSVTKSVQIAVEASAGPAPAAPAVAVQTENPDIKGIREAIEQRYKDAYESMTLDEMQKIWPTMSKQQKEAMNGAFKLFKAIKARYSCAAPSIQGETARCTCTETVTYTTSDNKRQGPVNGSIIFEMKKTSSGWLVQNRRGQ